MKRVILSIFMFIFSFVLFGCHGGGKSLIIADLPSEFDTSKNYKISFGQKMMEILYKEKFIMTQLKDLKSIIQI